LASVAFPAWYLGHHPDREIITCSYGLDRALINARDCRDMLTSPWHVGAFGTRLRPDVQAAHYWRTNAGGGILAAGVGGAITGSGANVLIIDDPVKNYEEAHSLTYRDAAWHWYCTTAYTRLRPRAAVIVIQTRWHQDDLAGRILADDGGAWKVISYPALNEAGDWLWPERYTAAEYERLRLLNAYSWEALYQQRPTAPEGGLFKLAWFTYYNGEQPVYERVIQSWDTAFKTGQAADYSACTTWGQAGGEYYLLDVYRARIEYPELKARAIALNARWNPSHVIVEDKASGQSLIQDLQRTTGLPIIPIKAEQDKTARAAPITGYVEAGRVHLPQAAPWLGDFLGEVGEFPHGAHDDQVDSMVHALAYMTKGADAGITWA
jgi:predicted phage terminase large subunit-like protein